MRKYVLYKRVVHIIGFIVVFVIILCALDYITGKNVYNNQVWEKIQDPNVEIDILIMGNSHAYTGINAEVLSDCLGKEVDVLGSGSQNMEETLAALNAVLVYKKPEIIILDVYAACHDSKIELQNESRGLLYNNLDGIDNYIVKCKGVLATFKWSNVLDGTFQLFRPTYTWKRWEGQEKEKKDTHGFVGRDSYAQGGGIGDYVKTVEEIYDSNEMEDLTEYNQRNFQRFLDITEEEGISVILCSGPTCSPSISKWVNRTFELASEYENVIWMEDMGLQMENMQLTIEDFYDKGHLNRRGAEKYTKYIGNLLMEICNIETDWSKVFAYKSEQCENLGDGSYRYTMENYSSDCLYQFKMIVNGEIIEQQDYSRSNTFTTQFDIREENIGLLCYMIPMSEVRDESLSRIEVRFMKPNECWIE